MALKSKCVSESPRGLVKTPIPGHHQSQSFWVSKSGVGPENVHFYKFSSEAAAAAAGLDQTLRTGFLYNRFLKLELLG